VIGDEPLAVLLVDDLMVGEPPCLKQMIDTYAEPAATSSRSSRCSASRRAAMAR
jgi:UTP--glucose-1-phosphate uridylyltransferase